MGILVITFASLLSMLSSHDAYNHHTRFIFPIAKQYDADIALDFIHGLRRVCHCELSAIVGNGKIIVKRISK